MAGGNRRRAAGFTLPLTMALGFSLMTLATAVVGMVVVSDEQAKHDARQFVDAASLESAVEAGLLGLEQNGVPQAAEWSDRQAINGLDVQVLFAATRYKPDIGQDGEAAVAAALSDEALRRQVAAAFAADTPDTPGGAPPPFTRFSKFVAAAGADSAQEDCLRRRLTIGRVGAQPLPIPPDIGLIAPRVPLAPGDVIDVRAEIVEPGGDRAVLWRRVRYTGKPERPWLTHDWRRLHLSPSDVACPPAPAAPAPGDLRLGP
jgi:hypothetical protein